MEEQAAHPAGEEAETPLLIIGPPQSDPSDLSALLEPLGQPIHTVRPWDRTCERLLEEPLACILVDARQGWTGGLDTAQAVRACSHAQQVPLLVLGKAPCAEADLRRAYALGRVDVVMEPLYPEAVRAKVRMFIELRLRERTLHAALERAGRAEAVASEKKRMLHTLLGNVPGVVYRGRNEPHCPLTYASEGARALCGYSPEDFTGGSLRWGDLIHPEDSARIARETAEALAARAPFTLTYRIRTRTGEERWVWERGVGVFGPGGEVRFLEGFVTDITAFRHAQEERERLLDWQRAEHAKLESILQQLPVAAHIVEAPSGRTLYSNAEAERLLGHSLLETRCIEDYAKYHAYHADGRRFSAEDYPLARVLRSGEALPEEEILYHRPGGARRLFQLSAGPIRDPGGKLCAAVAGFIDITERKRAQEDQGFLARVSETLGGALEAEAPLRRLVRQCVPYLGDGCMLDLVDPDGALVRLEVMTVDPAREALARELFQRYPPQLEAPYGPAAAIRTGTTWLDPELDTTLERYALDATHLDLMRKLGASSLLSVPLLARGQVLGALTFVHGRPDRRHDAQDQRLAEDVARRAALALDSARLYQEAQSAVRLRDEFLAVASHELRTPLTPLRLALAALARETAGLQLPRLRHHLDLAHGQVRRLASLVDALLEVGRLTQGPPELELARTDLGEVLSEVAAGLASRAKRVGSSLRVECEVDAHGHWDRQRLEQIVTQLISNAIRYGAGGPILARVEDLGDQVRLRVRDEGIGIGLQDQERIFGKFERAAPVRHYGGLGLGLFITRGLVEALGGRIGVDSRPGAGATFTVTLPRAGPQATPEPRAAPPG